jgi:hypothetical protein
MSATVTVPPGTELPFAFAGLVLGRLRALCTPAPVRMRCTLIAPAAGHCGPAGNGPVDAVRDLGHRLIGVRQMLEPVPVRVLAVQQTRCWLFSVGMDFAEGAGPGVDRAGLLVLPPGVGSDTARATQYMHDLGRGSRWSDLLLFGYDATASGIELLLAATDAGYARLLSDETAQERDR